ncbi:hypothetical protein DPMN_141290 [Dreissena polymorpha]|uniref:Uncharacterized protein n=1 Tax=Dreissena polymorpha TaxID=45954 RepID=A0A9D4GC28_DREPO|nr:hypothetical protein DPMN_141290 [Dreissena polymorpha]
MARTKQTARKSTEGKTPEKQVAAGSDQGASGGSTGQGATKAPSFPSKGNWSFVSVRKTSQVVPYTRLNLSHLEAK